jgi:hypothetical protein
MDEKDIRLGWGDYIHPNRLGHQVAGDAICDFLEERGFIPSTADGSSQKVK